MSRPAQAPYGLQIPTAFLARNRALPEGDRDQGWQCPPGFSDAATYVSINKPVDHRIGRWGLAWPSGGCWPLFRAKRIAKSMESKLQSSRYEFKYLVDETKAKQVRQFAGLYLEPDRFTVGKEGVGYAVYSLYMDSPDLLTCRATVTGHKNRFKLRIRFYDDNPTSPVFLEIKRRVNTVILKQRAAVKRSSMDRLVTSHRLDRSDLITDDQKNREALYNFCTLCSRINARPAAYVCYMREGYEPASNNVVRVTFDRNLRGGPFRGQFGVADLERWAQPKIDGVVLELKFTDRFPSWMHTLAETFDLDRTSVAKYVHCISLLHRDIQP